MPRSVLAVLIPAHAVSIAVVEQVHLAASETHDKVVVAFASVDAGDDPFVLFNVSGAEMRANGTRSIFSEHNEKGAQYHYRVELSDLPPLATVTYQACVQVDHDFSCSDVSHFRTLALESADWDPKLLFFGDMGRDGGELKHRIFSALPALINEVDKGGVDAVIHLGDFAYDMHDDGGKRGDEFMNRIQPIASKTFYQTVPGNHEIMDGSFAHYRMRFHMPHREELGGFRMWYSWNVGMMHIVGLSTEHIFGRPKAEQDAMIEWLEADLREANKNRAQQPWIVTLGHRPPYCSNLDGDCGGEGSEGERVRLYLEEVLYRNKVDVALWGHEHSYERLWPTYNNTVTQKDYLNPKAPVHIVSGAAGCNEGQGFCLNPILWGKGDWSAYRTQGIFHPYSYGNLRAPNATHLYLDQINAQTGHIFDHVWIEKTASVVV